MNAPITESLGYTGTYSPDDNKLRLYAVSRLPADLYERVRAAGFKWAPKQGLFVAPMWTPAREDLLLELCGEIGDEDSSLAERAEERAERFDVYSVKRAQDADSAHAAVRAIADGIPFGQPILVGHHSEKHARKDAERIESGMRRAVKAWETAQYWERRAQRAIAAAAYKERPDVRARRIKTLEAERRKCERSKADALKAVKLWENLHDDERAGILKKDGTPTTFAERAIYLAGMTRTAAMGAYTALTSGAITPEEAQRDALEAARRSIAWADRWISHYDNRVAYERAMLGECGGTVADKTGPQVGGGCKCWASPRGGWSYIRKVNKVSVTVEDNWGNGGRNFTRTIPFDKLAAIMTAAEVAAARDEGRLFDTQDGTGYILREKPADLVREETHDEKNERLHREHLASLPASSPQAAEFDAMRESLRAGVQVVSAPQLFPTPPALAARMVELAEIEPAHRILEPSAGTGNLIDAMPDGVAASMVEINVGLANRLASKYQGRPVYPGDFLARTGWELGAPFDRVVMNPPFKDACDIDHIMHAWDMVKPGGRLVALCADGPRQRAALGDLAAAVGGIYESLPAGSFASEGTSVAVALLVLDK